MVAAVSETLVTKVQNDLQQLLEQELGESALSSKTWSYPNFRISYLRAVSKLRPTFFEDDEDFLDKDKRVAEWETRKRFNELKKVWIKYDRLSPDKARDLGAEDQEIENDLDTIEEEIQEEWQDFAEELLDMLDDEEDEEDFGDEEDLDDLEYWRFERKQMRQDASLLKRRILERTMQRRAREEDERQRLEEEDRQRRQNDLEEKARRATKMAMVHEAALVALSPERRDSRRISFSVESPERYSPSRQQMMRSPLGRMGMSERNLVSPSGRKLKSSIAGLGMSERNLVSPSKQKMDFATTTKSTGTSERNLIPPSLEKLKLDAHEEEKMDVSESSPKHKSKKKSSSHKSKSASKNDGDPKKSKKSRRASIENGDTDTSENGDQIEKSSRRKSKSGSSKDGDTDSSEHGDDALLKKKRSKGENLNPPCVPKTPPIKRQTMGPPRLPVQLMCPSIDESVPESPDKIISSIPTRRASLTPSVSAPLSALSCSSTKTPPDLGVPRSESADTATEVPKKGVSSLRERFSHPSTPLPPPQMALSKYKYGMTSTRAVPSIPSVSGTGKVEEKSNTKKRQSLRAMLKTLERHELLSIEELRTVLIELSDLTREDEGAREEFASGKGNHLLHQILLNHHQNEESVMEACCRALVPVAAYENSRDALAHMGVIENILVGMLFHKKSALVQEHGCDALASFAANTKFQNWIVASNGIKALLKTQAAFYLNANVQTACFRCMTQLAIDNRETCRHLAAEGAVKALMVIMYMPEHEHCVKLHRVLLRAVAILARNDGANRGTIAKQDGIYLTLLAMESFPNDEDLIHYACEALCSLATEHAQNCETINKQEGLKILSKSMKDHFMHEGVQEGALSLLTNLTEQPEISKKFAEDGGIDRVLVAMRNFETTKIHEQGCLTLCNMSTQDENKETIRNLGGIRMIVAAMRLLGDSTFVQKSGCRALDSLGTNDQSKVTIAASGGISAMLSAMKTHPNVAGVQALAITALRKLATITRNRCIMKSNGGTDTVEAAIRKYPTHAHLQENGKSLVKLLDPTRALLVAESPKENQAEKVTAEPPKEKKSDKSVAEPPNENKVENVAGEALGESEKVAIKPPKESKIEHIGREEDPYTNGVTRKVDPSQDSPTPSTGSRRQTMDAPGYRAKHLTERE